MDLFSTEPLLYEPVAIRPESVVYFIQSSGEEGKVKIGTTVDLSQRLFTLQAGTSSPLIVIRSISGGKETERWMHARFADHKVSREWFNFTPDMLTVVAPSLEEVTPQAEEQFISFVRNRLVGLYNNLWPSRVYKTLANLTSCSPRTTERWARGESSADAVQLIAMMARDRRLKRAVFDLVEEVEGELSSVAQDQAA